MTINVGDLVVPRGRGMDFDSARAYGWPCKVVNVYCKQDGTEMIQFLSNSTYKREGGLVLREWTSTNLSVYVAPASDPFVEVVCDLIVEKYRSATCKAARGHAVYHFDNGQWVRCLGYTRRMLEDSAIQFRGRRSFRGKVIIKVRESQL